MAGWRWDPFGLLMLGATLVLLVLADHVGRRPRSPVHTALVAALLGLALWSAGYALELSAVDLGRKELFGAVKYAGIGLLGPAWLATVLHYTGRGHLVRRPLLAAAAVEPVLVLVLLAVPATHDLVRYYPSAAAGERYPVVAAGPLFWPHLVYTDLLLLTATALFVASLTRVSRLYWRQAAALIGAALLPWAVNLLYNFGVAGFARVDLTPAAFTVSLALVVWGVFRQHLLDLVPVARGVVVDRIPDGVVVLDAYDRVVDLNPAAMRILDTPARDAIGRPRHELLPAVAPGRLLRLAGPAGAVRCYELGLTPLADRRGRRGGQLLLLRDVTERQAAEEELRRVLAERTRVARTLQESLLPARLPDVPGLALAARYRPAGDGTEIGGDFYDVFPVGPDAWMALLGDVSGKGAGAAVLTALARYTLRALAVDVGAPSTLLARLNDAVARQVADERYCTVALGVLRALPGGWRLGVALGGHPPPLLVRRSGRVETVGVPGTLLGLLATVDLVDMDVWLAPGDLLCWYSDGVTDARRGRELFGEARLRETLATYAGQGPGVAVDRVVDAVRDFQQGWLRDDVAVLAVQVCG